MTNTFKNTHSGDFPSMKHLSSNLCMKHECHTQFFITALVKIAVSTAKKYLQLTNNCLSTSGDPRGFVTKLKYCKE
uniref:Uncharacterized protein n=1 Tax=Pararge aegeria TaxID=116150 RepID=S4PSD5_9NEOP